MADVPREKLSELVGRFGAALSDDPRRSKALLADICGGQYRGECAVLVTAVEEGVAGDLLTNSSGLPQEVLLDRLSRRLQTNRGVSADLARWGVESWAVALGVVAGGDTLATFKMDGLMPLIELAGADGVISAGQLDHLILEAKTRGVSEADARAYLSQYAATRGWQVGAQTRSPRARSKARAAPPPPPPPASPQRQFQPVNPPAPTLRQWPASTVRWAAGIGVGLVAIALIVVVVWVKEQPQLPPPQPATTFIPTPTPASPPTLTPEAVKQQEADREQRIYDAARGDISALQTYLRICSVCAYAGSARSEIAALEAPQPKRIASSTVLCGRTVDYAVDATSVAEPYRSFLGVWSGAAWNSRICGALIVSGVANEGTAQITYIYGPVPGGNFPWKQQSPIALIRDGQLSFRDEEGGNFVFRLNGPNVLQGIFVSAYSVVLHAVLTRDLSSVPQ